MSHDGAASLFKLEENDIIWAATLAERNIGAQSHGSDPDDLVRDFDERVPAQDPRPVRWCCL